MTTAGSDRPSPRPATLAANRKNALRSTGPKTPLGKRKAARNALRHGLAIPVWSDPSLSERIEALSRLVAKEGAEAHRLALARRAAEAQIDLGRVRAARSVLLAVGVEGVEHRSLRTTGGAAHLPAGVGVASGDGQAGPTVSEPGVRSGPRPVEKPDRTAAVFGDLARRLARLDRYEARARSRRKAAIRALDAATS